MSARSLLLFSLCVAMFLSLPSVYAKDVSMRPAEKELRDMKEAFMKKAPAEKIALYEQGIEAVRATGIEMNAIQRGEEAPDFTLKDSGGADVSLKHLLSEGPVVLVWYRGGWCPYCNIYLRRLQDVMADIEEQGARIVAIAPETTEKAMTTKDTNRLEFTILHDVHNNIAERYGVVFTLPDNVAASYKQAFDLAEYNGDNSYRLPLSATYIIDENGIVRYAYLNADYRVRAEPADIVTQLKIIASEDAVELNEDAL